MGALLIGVHKSVEQHCVVAHATPGLYHQECRLLPFWTLAQRHVEAFCSCYDRVASSP